MHIHTHACRKWSSDELCMNSVTIMIGWRLRVTTPSRWRVYGCRSSLAITLAAFSN